MDSHQKIEIELQTELSELRREVARLQVIEAKYQTLKQQATGSQADTAGNGAENVAQNMIFGLRAVTHISTVIAGLLDRDELLQTAVDLIQKQFDLYHVQIYLLDPGDDTLYRSAAAGTVGQELVAQGQTISFEDEQSLIARAARRRTAILVEDTDQQPNFLTDPLLPAARAKLAVPLSFGDTILGVLDMQAAGPHRFTQDDVSIGTILARQLTVALQNSVQHQRMQVVLSNLTRRDHLLSGLSKMGLDLMQRGPAAIQDSLARIGQASDVSRVYIFENFVDESDALCVRQTYEWAAPGIEPQIDKAELQHVPYDAVIPRWRAVLARGDKVVGLVRDFPDSERAILEPQNIRSMLVLPMFVDNEFYGFMGFDECRTDRAWKALEVDVLQTATIFIANAIMNQRLLEHARHQAERAQEALSEQQTTAYLLGERVKELNCLNDIGRAISESPVAAELLHWITERLPPAMRYPNLCLAAIETDDQIYGDPAALELPTRIDTPLRVMGETIGHIHTAYSEAREFLEEEYVLLDGIANRVGGYLESQRLAAQTQAALAEVRQSQQFLQTIVNNIPAPVFYKDVTGTYLGFNKAFLDFVGKTEAEMLGKTVYDLDIPAARAEELHNADTALLREPGVQVYETTVKHADGTLRDVIFNKATFTKADNSLGGLVGTMVDITARKAAEAERERLLAEVEAAYRQYVEQAWSGLLKEQQHGRWRVEHQPAGLRDQPLDEPQRDVADRGAKIETAIALRGQQIGHLYLEDSDANRKWTGDELALIEAVAEQLGQTVENLRLFDETQQRATREQLTRQIADKMRASPDIETIIQVGVQELAEVLGGSHVVVELDVPANDDDAVS